MSKASAKDRMNKAPTTRVHWLLWLAMLVLMVAGALWPVSTRATRAGGVILFFIVWLGLIVLCWQRRSLRWLLLGLTVLAAGFLALPSRALPGAEALRGDFVAGMRRYEGVNYVWGGESPKGIDCSGLIRRGLVDAMFLRGMRTLEPELVRRSLALWWNDCTAKALGEARDGLTVHVLDSPGLNQLDHTKVLPGDLAVTTSGVHIMAYLGNQQWIEADPAVGRVLTITVPTQENLWFAMPMKIVRWRVLSP